MMKQAISRTTAIVIALLMAIYLFPADVAAAYVVEENGAPAAEEQTETGETLTVDALFELTDLRTADTKYVKMSDGTIQALVYETAVHAQDENGVWQDIDNSLSEGNGTIDSARVKFAKKITGNGELLTLHDGNRKISLSLADAIKKTPVTVVDDGTTDEKYATKLEELSALSKVISSVRYNGILPETDVEYILSGNDLKENIVINALQDHYTYTFELALNNLTAVLSEDGSVVLSDGEEAVYTMPAPYMYDAEGEFSGAVSYTLSEGNGNGKYLLTVIANADWINEPGRVFPVTVDPSIITLEARHVFETSYVYNNSGDNSASNQMNVGYSSSLGSLYSYLRINFLSAIELPLTSADLHLRVQGSVPSALIGKELKIGLVDYNGAFSQLTGNTNTGTPVQVDKCTLSTNTTLDFDIFTTDVILARNAGESLCYKLYFDSSVTAALTLFSCHANINTRKPMLEMTFGYVIPEDITTTTPQTTTDHYYITNTNTLGNGRKMIEDNGNGTPHMTDYYYYNAYGHFAFVPGDDGVKLFTCYQWNYISVNGTGAGSAVVTNSTVGEEWYAIRLNSHWLLLWVGNPEMALTRNADGSLTVEWLTDGNNNQLWDIDLDVYGETNGHVIDSGIYYINSNYEKTFMIADNGNHLKLQGGLESEFGNAMAWEIAFAGNGKYLIRSVSDPARFLKDDANIYGTITSNNDFVKATFTISAAGGGNYRIQSNDGDYLKSDGDSVEFGSIQNDKTVWRICLKTTYHELSSFSVENVNDQKYLIGSRDIVSVTYSDVYGKTYADRINDFTYTSSDTQIVDFPQDPYVNEFRCKSGGIINGKGTGAVNITALHLPTGKTVSFRVWSGDAICCFDTTAGRLSAEASNSITLTDSVSSTASGFGKQLWFTEYAGTEDNIPYYYIHSLHVIDINKGDNSVITVKNGFVELSLKNNNGNDSKQKWAIIKSGNSYSLKNKSSGKYLKALGTSSDSDVTMSNEPYLWTLEPMTNLNLPNCRWSGMYNDNSLVHHIKVEVDTDSITSGSTLHSLLTNSSNYESLFGVWNNISDNIIVHYPDEDVSSLSNVFTITLKQDSTTPSSIGRTWGNGTSGTASLNWDYCYIFITSSYINREADFLTDTIHHELGHALKLSHVFSEPPNIRYHSDYFDNKPETEVISNMNYRSTGTLFRTQSPTFLDKVNLILKWGA